MDEPFSVNISNLPILNSLLAMRISALGMMGGGRQNCSLYALLRATETREESNTQARHQQNTWRERTRWSCLLTLIVDVKEPALLVVTTETYEHLIGCAARRLVGLSLGEDSQFPGCLLWAVPGESKRVTVQLYINGKVSEYVMIINCGNFLSAAAVTIAQPVSNHEAPESSATRIWDTTKQSRVSHRCRASSRRRLQPGGSLHHTQSNYTGLLCVINSK